MHNNKKEKITVIVNLLSDDMLSNRQHETNAHSAGKINQVNANVKDDLLTIAGSSGTAAFKTSSNTASSEKESQIEVETKNSNPPKKNESVPNTIGIDNGDSAKGNYL